LEQLQFALFFRLPGFMGKPQPGMCNLSITIFEMPLKSP
jgi:hypothetical protein